MAHTLPKSTSPRPRREPGGWTLAELLVVASIFVIATVLLLTAFGGQDAFTNRTVIEGIKNGMRDAMIREMTERNTNGYVLVETNRQGFVYVQGGQYPYRLTTTAAAMGTDSGTSQTSFSLRVDKLVTGAYVALATPLSTEGLSLVYYPEGQTERVAATTAAPPAYSTVVNRDTLGNRTVFYLQKDGKPVSNRVEFAFYSGRNINANASDDTTASLGAATQVQVSVSLLGNLSAVNNLGTATTTLQLTKAGSSIGSPFSIPNDLR